ncbi:MAG: ABC transporter ATP-binding protein/permease [Chloroflexota bacterium]|nr:ABC transporter ATP-binding protein/permease [Chloroflexota bacterium]
MTTLLRVLPYYRGFRLLMALGYLAVAGNATFNLAVPYLIGLGVDEGVAGQDTSRLLAVSVLIVLASALRGLCAFAQNYLGETAAQGGSYELRRALYAHVQQLSFSFHDQAQTGDLLTRSMSDVEQLKNFMGRGMLMIANLLLLVLGVAVALLAMNWKLALMSLVMLPLLYWRAAHYSIAIRPLFRAVQDQVARVATLIQDNAAGARVVKAFGHERQEIERFERENQELYERYLASTRLQSFNTPLLNFMANASTIAMLWVAGVLVVTGSLSLGELVAFYAYLLQIVGPIRQGGFLMSMASRAAASSERVLEVLDTPITVASRPDAIELPQIRGQVEFQDVSCAYYPGRPVIQHVTFRVEAGQTVALVGATGSGKTTIANLIPRFYDVTSGRVLIDGFDVRDVSLTSLRRQIGVVMQETTLFSGTIQDNIGFGRANASDEDIRWAARQARAEEFISRLPEAYRTIVGERGITLSGGQKQRVAIARALLMDPRILILDEFTSAVDAGTERLIRAALTELMHARTTFVIAHRLSTVRAADTILVLQRGRLVASGTHEELLASSPIYHEIHASQLADAEHLPLERANGRAAGASQAARR